MKLMQNKKGQTDSVFKLALVVIIIAAVLAIVAFLMPSITEGTTALGDQAGESANAINDAGDVLLNPGGGSSP